MHDTDRAQIKQFLGDGGLLRGDDYSDGVVTLLADGGEKMISEVRRCGGLVEELVSFIQGNDETTSRTVGLNQA